MFEEELKKKIAGKDKKLKQLEEGIAFSKEGMVKEKKASENSVNYLK